MDEKRKMLRHFLGALAYRTSKALKDAPAGFADFRAVPGVRTPHQLIYHMSQVLESAESLFIGEKSRSEIEEDFQKEVAKFFALLERLRSHLENGTPLQDVTPEILLQGPFSDAMTHAGQLAMLRRFFGNPVPPENFMKAFIDGDNVGQNQTEANSPAANWRDAEGRPQG